jgi:hypothetical protein
MPVLALTTTYGSGKVEPNFKTYQETLTDPKFDSEFGHTVELDNTNYNNRRAFGTGAA